MRGAMAKRWVLLMGLALGSAALAKPPTEFTPPPEMTPEEIAAAKAKSRSDVNAYGRDIIPKEDPFPWGTVIFFVVVLSAAAPFGYRAYKNTTQEIEDRDTFGRQ